MQVHPCTSLFRRVSVRCSEQSEYPGMAQVVRRLARARAAADHPVLILVTLDFGQVHAKVSPANSACLKAAECNLCHDEGRLTQPARGELRYGKFGCCARRIRRNSSASRLPLRRSQPRTARHLTPAHRSGRSRHQEGSGHRCLCLLPVATRFQNARPFLPLGCGAKRVSSPILER